MSPSYIFSYSSINTGCKWCSGPGSHSSAASHEALFAVEIGSLLGFQDMQGNTQEKVICALPNAKGKAARGQC